MSELNSYSPDLFTHLVNDLEAKGLSAKDVGSIALVRNYADARYLQMSMPGNMEAVNEAVKAHDRLGFLLPGYFRTTLEDISLWEPKGE